MKCVYGNTLQEILTEIDFFDGKNEKAFFL